jgi:hypothetical protein
MTNQTITSTFAAAPGQAAAVESPRTITYPLRTGGSLTVTCPTWCTTDHSDEVACGIHPSDLQHTGDDIHLDFNADGGEVSILQARLGQYPFSGDPAEAAPYVELTPEGSTAASVYCYNRLELDDEIRKVRAHLRALIELGDQLAEAQAENYTRHTKDAAKAWLALGRTDLQTLPVAYLLRVFGVAVVETEDTGRKAIAALYGEPGAMELRLYPDLSQYAREDQARRLLVDWFDNRSGGAA